MARVVFVSLYDRNAYGLRLMSASLRRHGHHGSIIFLKHHEMGDASPEDLEPGADAWLKVDRNGRMVKFADLSDISACELELLGGLVERLQPDVIGLTVNSPLRRRAVEVTRHLRNRIDVPVIWGGFEATVNPERCLESCDFVCRGEGDEVIIEVANRLDACGSASTRADRHDGLRTVSNLGYRSGHEIILNPIRPLVADLDHLAWRDDSPRDKYSIDNDELVEEFTDINDKPVGVYQTLTSRGCPYRCTYCGEVLLQDLYAGEKFLRRRSPADVIGELERARETHGIEAVQFEDEIFTMNRAWLDEFMRAYRQRVALPLIAYLYPSRRIGEILDLLGDALHACCLGLQSGSAEINRRVFHRLFDRDLFLDTARLLKARKTPFYIDVITFNPYEGPRELRETLDVLLEIGGGFGLAVNKLYLVEGLELHDRIRRDGLAEEAHRRQRLYQYYARLFHLASMHARARPVIRAINALGIFRLMPRWLDPSGLGRRLGWLDR